MAEGSRMGWEVEMHGIHVAWRRQGDNAWWPLAEPNFNTWGASLTPAGTSIFVPADRVGANIAAYGNENNPNWTGLWGFSVCPDALGRGTSGVRRGECIMEVNTSAQLISDYHYWYWAETCLRQFYQAIGRFSTKWEWDGSGAGPTPIWRPLSELLDEYNARVEALPVPGGVPDHSNVFMLKLSDRVSRFRNGNPILPVNGLDGQPIPANELTGVHWEPVFAVGKPVSDRDYCDVQVNYSVKLGWLSQNLAAWIGLWGGMWTHVFNSEFPPLDPDVGDLAWSLELPGAAGFRKAGRNPLVEVYRTQLYAAAWRAADIQAGVLLANHVQAAYQALPPMDRSLVKGLLTYLLAAGSVTVARDGGSPKNCTPQLPKTSPAAIARLIRARSPAAAAVMNTLAGLGLAAQTIMTNTIRNMAQLVAIGGLPTGRPQTGSILQTYPEFTGGNMYMGDAPPGFVSMWSNALNPPAQPAGPPNPNYGLVPNPPFNCMWSESVKTGIAPLQQADTDILIGFESRYSANILNIGFNPMVKRGLFTKSYLSLVAALANPQLAAASPLIGDTFDWDAFGNPARGIPITLQRNLAAGFH